MNPASHYLLLAGMVLAPYIVDDAAPRHARIDTEGEAACDNDDDCVPNACCHASGCVNTAYAPECDGACCTQECRDGTLDCGGTCTCDDKRCTPHFADIH